MASHDRRSFLNVSQHGFRSGSSCLSGLFNVFDYLMNMNLLLT